MVEVPLDVSLWQTPVVIPPLDDEYMHLWTFSLPLDHDFPVAPEKIFTPDEIRRAARLADPGKRTQFLGGRACLRLILSHYLSCAPAEIRLCYNRQGKPFLDARHRQQAPLFFNLSHSADRGLLGVLRKHELGVDLEQIDPQLDFAQTAHYFFTAEDQLFLEQRPQTRKRRCFYRLWTRKEAQLKALGCGLVSPAEDMFPEGNDFFVKLFPLPDQYLCAVATREQINGILRMRWPDTATSDFFNHNRLTPEQPLVKYDMLKP